MPVIKNVATRLEKRDVLRGLGIKAGRAVRPEIDRLVDELLNDKAIMGLVQPAIAYEIYSVRDVKGEDFTLANGTVLQGTTLPRVFSNAKFLAIVAATIGPGIEDKAAEEFKSGSRLKGLILDAMGSPAAENMRFSVHDVLSKEAEKRGLSLSSSVSPGGPSWDIREQFKLIKLVPASEIGIKLTETAMLIPRKSMTMAMGIGEDMPVWSATERCNSCSRGASCIYRYTAVHECDTDAHEAVLR